MTLTFGQEPFLVENCRTDDISVWYLTQRLARIDKRIAKGRARPMDQKIRARVAKQLAEARVYLCRP